MCLQRSNQLEVPGSCLVYERKGNDHEQIKQIDAVDMKRVDERCVSGGDQGYLAVMSQKGSKVEISVSILALTEGWSAIPGPKDPT